MKKTISVLASLAVTCTLFSSSVLASSPDTSSTDLFKKVDATSITNQANVTALISSGSSTTKGINTALAAAPTMQAANVFNFSARDIGTSVIQTSDGGYVFTGTTTSAGNADVLLAKTDSALNLQWAYSYGSAKPENGTKVRATSDGGFIVAGTGTASNNYQDVYVVKTDSAGTMQWSSTYGGSFHDVANAMEVAPDGGFIVVGTTTTSATSAEDAYMLKLSSTGSVEWSKTFGTAGIYPDTFYGVANVPGGGYVAVGSKAVATTGGYNAYGYIAKVNSAGGTLFGTTSGRYASFNGVAATSTGYVATGSINTTTSTGYDFYTAKFSTTGTGLWTRKDHVTGGDFANDVKMTKDGNYAITGFTTPAVDNEDLMVMKVDNNGTAVWSSVYDFSNTGNVGRDLWATSDGGFIVVGSYDANHNQSNYDALLVKFSQ